MQIKKLKLWNFRNYQQLEFSFNSKNIFLLGENGQGKSNFLEAIYLVAFFRSYRTNNLKNCIQYGANNFVIEADFQDEQNNFKIAFQSDERGKKKLKVNSSIKKTLSEFYGKINLLIISPEDLVIIEGSPAQRRKFLDYVISFIDHDYYLNLLEFNKILKQRNTLLKNKSLQIIDIWDQRLAEKSKHLKQKRADFILQINQKVKEIYKLLGYDNSLIEVIYKTDFKDDMQQYLDQLKEKRSYDLTMGNTSFGIHHDDFIFYFQKNKAIDVCSQGQKRALAIALKMTEYQLKKEKSLTQPIILMDDTLLELDEVKSTKIFQEIINQGQVIACGTKNNFDFMQVVRVEQGKLLWS